jgi:class 3 adenylate cyclase/predicted ATPase
MTFEEILDQAVAMLQRRGRIAYSALKRQFDLDDDYLGDLKDALLFEHPVVDEEGKGLVWTGEIDTPPEPMSTSLQSVQWDVTHEARPRPVEPPPHEPHTPDAERRQLTVMFSDLVDSTRLSGQLDPEDYREVLRAYQATCSEMIHRFDGYIAQYLGDALLVYFGYPQAHEDEGQRAVLAGLGMLEAMRTLNTHLEQDKGIRLAIRVGIHTGLTVVGDIGEGQKHELLALGEAPNVASRVQGVAEPDTVAISTTTFQLVEGYFTCQDLGSHMLKGVETPVHVYRVLSESGAQSRLDIVTTRGLTPLVGREQEVGLLLERWGQVKDGQGQVVLLSGEGGIGKSRLAQVLKDHIAGEPHTRWECRSSPYYQHTALYPITDLFERTLQWHPDNTPDEKLAKLEQTLSQYRLPLEESVPLLTPLLSLPILADRYPPLALSPQRQRQKTLETIVAILLEQAEPQPVLFILEDVHWTDPTTLEFLDLLIDQVPTAQMLTLLTCRPTFQPPWSSRSYLAQVTLNRLSRSQIARMAEHVTGGKTLPADVLQQIVEKTDGVPLFVEEMTKSVLESGVLKETNAHYDLAGSFTTLAIPATLQDSLMARLDRLMTAKVIAQLGATIGRQFSYELLQTVSELDEATLKRELGRLVEAELVYQRGLPPHATYIFKHALVQDTAYESLLRSTRQGYHRRIAEVLEARFPETAESQPELLAHHYTEAGLNEQAIGYWQQAGEQAIARSANEEAISHLTTALRLLQALPDSSDRAQQELILQTALGPALIATKGWAASDVEHTYRRALELSQQMGDTPQRFPTLWGLFAMYITQAKHQMAFELAEIMRDHAQSEHDPASLWIASRALGESQVWRGEFIVARTHLEQGLTRYTPEEYQEFTFLYGEALEVTYRSMASWCLWHLGYPDQALERANESLEVARRSSHPFSLVYAQTWAAFVHHFRREAQLTQELAEAAIALSNEHGFPFWRAGGTLFQGWALTEHGQVEAGISHMRQGLAAWRATGAELLQPGFLALLARAYGNIGQPEDGLRLITEALDTVNQTGERYHESELYRLKGKLLTIADDSLPMADCTPEDCFHKALSIARDQHAKSWELRAATSLARLWQSQTKRQDASALLAPVYGWFTEGFDTADLQDAKALLDELEDGR